MNILVLSIVVGVLVAAGLVVGLVFLILFLVQQLGGTTGGWRRLLDAYPATQSPTGQLLHYQTIQVGAVVYKRCVTIGLLNEGLCVTIWGKNALIPWSEFKAIGQATLYWQRVPKLTTKSSAC